MLYYYCCALNSYSKGTLVSIPQLWNFPSEICLRAKLLLKCEMALQPGLSKHFGLRARLGPQTLFWAGLAGLPHFRRSMLYSCLPASPPPLPHSVVSLSAPTVDLPLSSALLPTPPLSHSFCFLFASVLLPPPPPRCPLYRSYEAVGTCDLPYWFHLFFLVGLKCLMGCSLATNTALQGNQVWISKALGFWHICTQILSTCELVFHQNLPETLEMKQ